MKIFIDFDNTLTRGKDFMTAIFAQVGKSFDEILPDYREYRKTGEFSISGLAAFYGERGVDMKTLEGVLLKAPEMMGNFIAPDARAFLQALKEKGYELILLTRSAEPEIWQHPKVMASGLAEYFSHIEIHPGEKQDVLKKLGIEAPFVFIDDTDEQIVAMEEAFPAALCVKHTREASLLQHLPEIYAYIEAIEKKSSVSIVERTGITMPELPLPLYSSTVIADCALADGEVLTISLGLDQTGVDAFKKRSCDESDEELMQFTSDHERICLGSYEAWYAKERYPFALMSGDELAGLIWFGPKEFPGVVDRAAPETAKPWHTFAIRTYMPYRGKRLAFPFSSFVFRMFDFLFPGSPVWLDTDKENTGAVKLYTKLGFKEYGQTESGRLVMVRM
jgi:FMN phosphatase YigB (HAD superfamily)